MEIGSVSRIGVGNKDDARDASNRVPPNYILLKYGRKFQLKLLSPVFFGKNKVGNQVLVEDVKF